MSDAQAFGMGGDTPIGELQADGFLADALALAGLGAFAWDLESDVVALDGRAREIWGFGADEAVAAPDVFARIDPADLSRVKAEVAAAREAVARFDTEYRVRRPDGTTARVASQNRMHAGPDGRAVRATGVFRDITAERESEARFRAVQDTSIDGFMVLESVRDEQGRIVDFVWRHANAAAARIVGRPVEAFVGRRLLEEMPGNREEGLFDAYVRVVETGEPWTHEFDYKHEGVDVYIRLVAAKVGDGFAVSFADLSGRRQAEKALAESEATQRLALEAGGLGAWSLSIATDTAHRTPRHDAIFGYGEPLDEWGYSRFLEHVLPEDRDEVDRRFRGAMEAGHDWDFACRIRRANDGALRWIEARGQPLRGPGGEITGFAGVVTDVTERREADAQLRESEARLRAIVETARDYAIFTTDAEGRIETWPRGAQEVFGWSATEAIGQPAEITYTLEDRAQGVPEKERQEARDKGQAPDVRWHLRRDGSRVFIDGVVRPLESSDGVPAGFVKVGQDVTERRRAEAALRESEARLRELNETLEARVAERTAEREQAWRLSQDLLVVVEADGRLAAVNEAWMRLLGWRPEELVGLPFARFTHPDDLEAALAAFEGVFAAPLTTPFEFRFRHRDGSHR